MKFSRAKAVILRSTHSTQTISNLSYSISMPNLQKIRPYDIHWFEEVTSTMDKARDIMANSVAAQNYFSLIAQHQSQGRGTRGRQWNSANKNMFLTIALNKDLLPIPITLFPLRIGTIIATCINSRITSGAEVKLKWPNDVLIEGKKICGVLIEIEKNMLLVGIGCNVMKAPDVNCSPSDSTSARATIRPSTCIADHNTELAQAAAVNNNLDNSYPDSIDSSPANCSNVHNELAVEISDCVYTWLQSSHDSVEAVLQDFSNRMDYNTPQRLRDISDPNIGTVLPIALNKDGTLQVKYLHNKAEATLSAEYLW